MPEKVPATSQEIKEEIVRDFYRRIQEARKSGEYDIRLDVIDGEVIIKELDIHK